MVWTELLSALFFAGRSPGGNCCGDLWCYLASIHAHAYGESKRSATIKVGTKAGWVLNKPGGRLGGGFGWQTSVAYALVFKTCSQADSHKHTCMKKAHWKNFSYKLMKVRRICHSHTPSLTWEFLYSRPWWGGCTLPERVSCSPRLAHTCRHHASLQTSALPEASMAFWWTSEGDS